MAFRRVEEVKLSELITLLNANSSVVVELPDERADERVNFELIGVEYREVLDYLGLSYK
jgi:hypothetical protein